MPAIGLTLLAYLAFIALGLPDGLIGVAWPSMRSGFNQPIESLGLLGVTATSGYLFSSFYANKLLSYLKTGGLLAASCALTGIMLLAYCAAPSWLFLVALGLFMGFGAGGIDAGLNIYAAENFGKRQMQWLHASYGIGVTLGPLIMTAGLRYSSSWRPGYIAVGLSQIALAICFVGSIPSWNRAVAAKKEKHPEPLKNTATIKEALLDNRVQRSLLLFFLYTGAEAMLGTWAYSILTESRGVEPAIAGLITGSYWAAFTTGRIFAGFYSKHVSTHVLVLSSLIMGLIGALLLRLNISQTVSITGVALTGIAIAPVFPALVSATSKRVGERLSSQAIGMQMSAGALGIAAIPALAGVLAGRFSTEAITLFLAVIFAAAIIVYVTFTGRAIRN